MSRRHVSGFTLIELMVTIAVLAVLITIGLPSFQQTIRSNRLATSTNLFLASVSLARSEAIRSTQGAGVCASSNGTTCASGTDWSGGWMVWNDTNRNGTFESTDTVVRYTQAQANMVITGPAGADTLSFDSRGRLQGAVPLTVTLRPSNCGGTPMQRSLQINLTGQMRKNGGLGACP